MSRDAASEPYLDPRDREYAETLARDERNTVVSTVERFRRPDRLRVGDGLPRLDLMQPEDGRRVGLDSLVRRRPLVLVFGSFT